jgi:hypothetical protein
VIPALGRRNRRCALSAISGSDFLRRAIKFVDIVL